MTPLSSGEPNAFENISVCNITIVIPKEGNPRSY
jgi:hypothetical protein